MIYEAIVTTQNLAGQIHIAPFGYIPQANDRLALRPFQPSQTLDNILQTQCAVINAVTDVRIFAGCLTGRYDWPYSRAKRVGGVVLQAALAHQEIQLEDIQQDVVRPTLGFRVVYSESVAPFPGFNRAQAAVIEAAVLVSRLHMFDICQVRREMNDLKIVLEKTAGEQELEAWSWLQEKLDQFT